MGVGESRRAIFQQESCSSLNYLPEIPMNWFPLVCLCLSVVGQNQNLVPSHFLGSAQIASCPDSAIKNTHAGNRLRG